MKMVAMRVTVRLNEKANRNVRRTLCIDFKRTAGDARLRALTLPDGQRKERVAVARAHDPRSERGARLHAENGFGHYRIREDIRTCHGLRNRRVGSSVVARSGIGRNNL